VFSTSGNISTSSTSNHLHLTSIRTELSIPDMASKEIQQGRKSSRAPGTPPDSPDLLPSSGLFTSNDVHQFIEMVKAVVASPTPHNTSHTPPEGPTPRTSSTPLTMEHLEKLVEKLIQATKDPSAASDDTKSDALGDAKPNGARASKLAFKMINEVYVFKLSINLTQLTIYCLAAGMTRNINTKWKNRSNQGAK